MSEFDDNLLKDNLRNAKNEQEDNFNIEIGGIGLSIFAVRDSLFDAALDKYKDFLCIKQFHAKVTFYELKTFLNSGVILEAFSKYTEIYTKTVEEQLMVYRWDFFGYIDTDTQTGKFILFNNTFMTYESIIRIYYSLLTVENNGFLIHSSSLVHQDKGYTFFGISGSGKSTVVKLSESEECLTDELSMILKKDGSYVTCGTPFHGEIPIYKNKIVPLANMFLLKKDKNTYFLKLSHSEIYPTVLRNVLFFSNDWKLRQKIFATIIDLSNHVDIYEMNFEKNNKFWRIIDNGFNKED